MPRGPIIPPAKRQEWLQRHDRGERIDHIAKEENRTPRAVQEHIARARRERDAHEVRIGLLREAYQRHYDDLLGIFDWVGKRAGKPDPSGIWSSADPRTRRLIDALRVHIPRSPLWKACGRWEEESRLVNVATAKGRRRIKSAVSSALRDKEIGANVQGFEASLWRAVKQEVEGRDTSEVVYATERTADGLVLRWDSFELIDRVADCRFLEPVKVLHGKLLEEIVGSASKLVNAVREPTERWTGARHDIEAEIEDLLLRHIVPGTCDLCPGTDSTGVRRTRTRRQST